MRKAIKKIAALTMGATMLGATLMAASAGDLNKFPEPFVTNGQFSGTLVVGDNAAAEDVVGVSDISMSLQFAAGVPVGGSGGTTTTTVQGDAYQFTKSSNQLNLYESLSSVRATLRDTELAALADGTFKGKSTETYQQKITNSAANVSFEDYSTINEEPQLYLLFKSGTFMVDYDLDFSTAPTSDSDSSSNWDDFEDEVLTILGREYTITKAENKSVLTLMSGAVQDTLEVGETKTYTINGLDYEVTVMIVSGDTAATASTKLIINDEVTKTLSKDDTFTLKDGTDLGIKEILPTKSGDIVQNLVEFYLGAQKLVLDGQNGEMDIGENTGLDDVAFAMTTSHSGAEIKLSKMNFTLMASSDRYVPMGSSLREALVIEEDNDQVEFLDKLGIDIEFTGLKEEPTEEVKIQRRTDESIELVFTNKNNVEYKLPWVFTNDTGTTFWLGKEAGKELYHRNGDRICDEDYFIIENDEITRILQLTNIKNSTSTSELKVRDVGTSDSTTYDFVIASGLATINIDGYDYSLTVENGTAGALTGCAFGTKITDDTDGDADIFTRWETMFNLTDRNQTDNLFSTFPLDSGIATTDLMMRDDTDKQEDDDTQDVFRWNVTWDSSNTALEVTNIKEADQLVMRSLDSDSKKSQGYNKWGAFFERDTNGDQDSWTITIPENEAEAEIFFTAGTTTIASGASVEGQNVVIQRIDVGATKLASEVAGLEKTQNLLLVGGPCANAGVEAASSDFPSCSGWSLEAGEALIQIVEQADGSVAMLVAGTTAADTRAATGVVAGLTDLQVLADGVSKQKLTVATGVMTDMVDVMEEVMEEEAMEEEAMEEEAMEEVVEEEVVEE